MKYYHYTYIQLHLTNKTKTITNNITFRAPPRCHYWLHWQILLMSHRFVFLFIKIEFESYFITSPTSGVLES